MCGIVGFVNCGSKEELHKSVIAVNHRGPDFQDYKWFEKHNSGLGHARLSIIDLSTNGNQPMYDKTGKNWIILNGEIFNYVDIRKILKAKGYSFVTNSDTEVLLKANNEWGTSCLEYLNGMFSFAIFNEESGNVFAARDRLGIKPFYYFTEGNKLVFASEIKSILECKAYMKEPDLRALHTPVHFQVSPYTGFKNIYKLQAGHYLTFSAGKLEITKYWDIYPSEKPVSYKEALEKLESLLIDSIDLQMVSDVPVGSLLSGGLDSSIISVLMQKRMNRPLNTFTIKFKKKDLKRQGNVNDSYYARKLADQFGFEHHEIQIEPDIVNLLPKLIWHLDEPIADPAAINTYLISKAAKDLGIKVLLSGMGADEVFSGYRAHLACIKADIYQKIPLNCRKLLESLIRLVPESNSKRDFKYIRWLKSFLRIASYSQYERALLIKNSALSEKDFGNYFADCYPYYESPYIKADSRLFNSYPNLSYLTKLCYVDSKIYLADHNLTYSDKAMMAAGVEGRPPLIDHRITEFMFTLSPAYRIHGNTQKYLLKKVAENYLPHEIIYRPKAPFSAPMRGWLKGELKVMVHDILSYGSIKRRGIYNPDFVQSLILENNKGIKDNSQLIWRLMINEIWFRTFFD